MSPVFEMHIREDSPLGKQRAAEAEVRRLTAAMAKAYWLIRGENPVKELLAVERVLSDALQAGSG